MQRGFTNPIELQHSASLQTEKKRNLNINFLHINKADCVFNVDLLLSWVVVTFRINI